MAVVPLPVPALALVLVSPVGVVVVSRKVVAKRAPRAQLRPLIAVLPVMIFNPIPGGLAN